MTIRQELINEIIALDVSADELLAVKYNRQRRSSFLIASK